MAILTKQQLLEAVQAKLTDSDDDLAILENITDTINEYEGKVGEDWKTKYEENDKAWRERYKARFTESTGTEVKKDEPHLPDKENEVISKSEDFSIDDLFKESEDK